MCGTLVVEGRESTGRHASAEAAAVAAAPPPMPAAPTIVVSPAQPPRLMVDTPQGARERPLRGVSSTQGRDSDSDISILRKRKDAR